MSAAFQHQRRRDLVIGAPVTTVSGTVAIPEAQGAARAWEVTGDARWRRVVEAYWEWAVTRRGGYCTGGQTCGEIWSPPFEQAARLGDKNQEHCTVYNMMRLAEYVWRWTGDLQYADYWERNLVNGVLAQQHPVTGQIAYFLPMEPGAVKVWGSETQDFWCCHGSLVQAHTLYPDAIYYAGESDDGAQGLTIAQYIPSTLRWEHDSVPVQISLRIGPQTCATRRPDSLLVALTIDAESPVPFDLRLRLPWWLHGAGEGGAGTQRVGTPNQGVGTLTLNGTEVPAEGSPSSLITLDRRWSHDTVRLEMPMGLTTCPLPDDPERVAFMFGPAVLAGLSDGEAPLAGDPAHPEDILAPDNEREWAFWRPGWRTTTHPSTRFLPLYAIEDQRYTVYWPVGRNSQG